MNIGKAIKELRKKAGLNQTELATKVGIQQTALSQIEAGTRNPQQSTLIGIAATLKMSVAGLYVHAIGIDDIEKKASVHDIFLFEEGKKFLLKALENE